MVIHCIKCGVIGLTASKELDLNWEYGGFQWWMQFGIDKDILSQHKHAKGYYYDGDKIKYKDYPLVVPPTYVKYRNKNTKLTPHWIKISVRKRKGIGIWLPIRPHKKLPKFEFLRDSLLVKNRKNKYELRLIFDIPQKKQKPRNVMAIDLGEKVIATVCDSVGNKLFLGRKVRSNRRHFAWLRRRLGQRKLLKKIKAVGNRERNIVNNLLHHVSDTIIKLAKQNRSLIVLGDLRGIQKKRTSKRLNRIVFNMPSGCLTKMIRYKAEQNGLHVILVDEKNTSITCHSCGNCDKAQRKTQGLFSCKKCGLQYNADLNGAQNMLNRAREQDFLAGALAEALESAASAS